MHTFYSSEEGFCTQPNFSRGMLQRRYRGIRLTRAPVWAIISNSLGSKMSRHGLNRTFADSYAGELARLDEDGLRRSLRVLPGSGGLVEIEGRRTLNFSSNDYLDLANDPRLKRGAIDAIEQYGCGATSSRLLAGHLDIHERLEKELAAFVGKDTATVFPTGFQTNVGVLTSLAGEGDVIFSDALNHASIVDGCRLSRARVCVYRHCDMKDLERLLRTVTGTRRIIVTDTVFSMDGDLAPVREIAQLAEEFGAVFAADEAHAIGVYGGGAGLCAEQGASADVIVGTLSKALGGEGGFAAGPEWSKDLLINRARTFIFSTGLAPACAGSALAALDVVRNDNDLGPELLARAATFRQRLRELGVGVPDDRSQIVPLVIGENNSAMDLAASLLERGVLAAAVRPPSVPKGTARLRFSVTLAHERHDLDATAEVVADSVMRVQRA